MLLFMDQQLIIAGMEERARKLGLPISEICRQADVHPTTFSRWKKSEKNPDPIGASMRTLSALDVALKKLERPVEQGAAA